MRLLVTRTASLAALAVITMAGGAPACADVIYLCENETSVVVRSGTSPRAAGEASCVQQWQVARQRDALQRQAAGAIQGKGYAQGGASSRDFCVPGEPCHLPLPHWRPRWDYEPAGRHIYARFWFD